MFQDKDDRVAPTVSLHLSADNCLDLEDELCGSSTWSFSAEVRDSGSSEQPLLNRIFVHDINVVAANSAS